MEMMVDIETLSTDARAVIVSIGAVAFDKDDIKRKFFLTADIDGQIRRGRLICGETLKWWFLQNEKVQEQITSGGGDIKNALTALSLFYKTSGCTKIWANGVNFDVTILENAMKQFGVEIPWYYKDVIDFRTFKALSKCKVEPLRVGAHHNALDDAISQAKFVQAVYNESDS